MAAPSLVSPQPLSTLPVSMCTGRPSPSYVAEDAIDEDLLCGICLQPFEDPVVACANGHVFCKDGVAKIPIPQMSFPTCPTCRSPLSARRPPVIALARLCGKLSVVCTHHDLGCTATITRDRLAAHVSRDCRYPRESCHNCGEDVAQRGKEREKHDEECSGRWVPCAKCRQYVRWRDMEEHGESCVKVGSGASGSGSSSSRKRKREPTVESVIPNGTEVAAKTSSGAWLLATVVRSVTRDKYEVVEIPGPDPAATLDGEPRHHTLPATSVLPVTAPPSTTYPPGTAILALYPGTRELISARVVSAPAPQMEAGAPGLPAAPISAGGSYRVNFARDEVDEEKIVAARYAVKEAERRYKFRAR